jgi:cold-inducible RNA-binding protein
MEESRLYVGGLPYSMDETQLREMFAAAGSVHNATIITDKFSGRSKGFGFVEMANPEEAQKAIELFNEKEVDGRKITVNIARLKEERRPH